jgi:hypothetical protein
LVSTELAWSALPEGVDAISATERLRAELQTAGPLRDLFTAAGKALAANLSKPLTGPAGIDTIALARTAAWAKLSPAITELGFAIVGGPRLARILLRRISAM